MTQYTQRQTRGLILLVAFLAGIGPLTTDAYLPAIPELAVEFGVTSAFAQWSISSYFLGIAGGQIFAGPLSDRFGRRPVLLGGFLLFVVATFVCAIAPDIETLISARAVQGMAAAASPAAGRAVVRDIWQGNEAARVMSYVTMAVIIAPLVAPSLGGVMIIYWSWRSIFWMLLAAGVAAILAILLWMPETHGPERRGDVRLKDHFKAYRFVLRRKRALAYLVCGGLSYAAVFAYITSSSVVYIELYGVDPTYFGLYFGLNVVGLFLGTFINSQLVTRFGYHNMIAAAVIVSLVGSVFLLGVSLTEWGGLPTIMAGLFLTVAPASMLGANCTTGLMDLFPKNAGGAVALFGVAQFGLGSLASLMSGLIFVGSTLSMSVPMILCSIGSFAGMLWLFATLRQEALEGDAVQGAAP